MEIFIKKVLQFISIFIVYSGLMYAINFLIFFNQIPKNQNINILIAGDSHPQTAMNPRLFESAKNYAQEAEPYYISYWKLKEYLKYNQIDTLILGFSFHNISGFNDRKLSDPFWSTEMFSRIYPVISILKLISLEWEVDITTFLRVKFQRMCLFPRNHKIYKGEFEPEPNTTDLSNVEGIIKRHYYYNTEITEISKISKQYLDSILSLCKEKNIVPILISNPLHNVYLANVPNSYIHTFQSFKSQYMANDVIVLDYTMYEYEDEYFFNPDHLNRRGADKFTKHIIKKLNKIKS